MPQVSAADCHRPQRDPSGGCRAANLPTPAAAAAAVTAAVSSSRCRCARELGAWGSVPGAYTVDGRPSGGAGTGEAVLPQLYGALGLVQLGRWVL
jgi:hypothetical protein